MARKLKVFRTAIGFHDAYVAAPSRKAALEAWGADADLFARGAAEVVTDPGLSEEPLAHPGQVIRRLRGTEAEYMAALETDDAARAPRKASAARASRSKPRPRPDRQALDEAEDALVAAEREVQQVLRTFRERERQLARERGAAEQAARETLGKVRSARDIAKASYERALERWRG